MNFIDLLFVVHDNKFFFIIKSEELKMYALIDGLCMMGGIAGFVLSLVKHKAEYCPIPIAWLIFYPFLTESIYNICAKIAGRFKYDEIAPNSRIVYHQGYNLSFCGIQKLHPFDSHKYQNIFAILKEKGIVNQVIKPNKISRRLLLQKMSKFYLIKLCYSIPLSSYIQMPLCFLPGFLLRWRVLNPMLLATQGTILASINALKLRWSINLSGGYHHAHCQLGGGFCIYPDITLAIHYLRTRHNIKKAMIIDLDAHQGNGHQRDFLNDQNAYIIDAYNHHIYPNDIQAKQAISDDLSITYKTSDDQYLKKIRKSIENGIQQFKPQFILYNAGTDCLVGDPLGGLQLSEQAIILRDQTVIQLALKYQIPVTMVLSGGYQKINAKVIAKSIENLYKRFDRN